MIDKLDVITPRGFRLRREIQRELYSPDAERKFKLRSSKLYEMTADLRPLGIPIMLSTGNRMNRSAGMKAEVLEAGDLCRSDWIGELERVFIGDVEDAELPRVDCTADVDVSVPEMSKALWCRFKRRTQQEYGDAAGQLLMSRVCTGQAMTLYSGKKPRQLRIYNKVAERIQKQLPRIHRRERAQGLQLSTYEEIWQESPLLTKTRVERQMGEREAQERWGIRYLGEVHRIVDRDPFEMLRFVEDAKRISAPYDNLDPAKRWFMDLLREERDRVGIDALKCEMKERFGGREDGGRAGRKWWNENEQYILAPIPGLSRETLTKEYRRSTILQMAA